MMSQNIIEFNKISISLDIIKPDSFNWILKHVSKTSDDVIPLCKKLASFPTFSIIDVKNLKKDKRGDKELKKNKKEKKLKNKSKPRTLWKRKRKKN